MNQSRKAFFEGQVLHLFLLVSLIIALAMTAQINGFGDGAFLGIITSTWVVIAVGIAITHQVYVWLCWRLLLADQSRARLLGGKVFFYYKIIFAVLIIGRPVTAFALSWANRGTLPIAPALGIAIACILFIPAAYLMFSIKRYFSFDRAFGIDHFDPAYRSAPLVRMGIFAWTPNAMYVFGFFILWVPAFLFQSTAGFAVAAFSHAYIWVHYFSTEKPDMKRIYGTGLP